MAQYQVTLNGEVLYDLFQKDEGVALLDMAEYLVWREERQKARKQASKVHQLC